MLMNCWERGRSWSATARTIAAAFAIAIWASATPALADPSGGQTPPPSIGGSSAATMFSDVPAKSWPYGALQRLAADGVLTGYSNGKFKGDQTLTRYEVAVLVDRASKAIEAKMAAGTQVDRDDIVAMQNLLSEFGPELKNLEEQVVKLQQQTNANTDQIDAVSEQLHRMQIHVGYYLRPGTYSDDVVAVNGPTTLGKGTTAVAAHGVLPAGFGPTPLGSGMLGSVGTDTSGSGQNVLTTGDYQHGTSYQDLRLAVTGDVGTQMSYNVRLENKLNLDGTNYLSTSTPSYCTSTTPSYVSGVNACSAQSYSAGNSAVRFNVGYVQFKPGKLWVRLGRYQQDEGAYNLMELSLGNYPQGVEVGYDDGRLGVAGGYGFGDSALTNTALYGPTATSSQQAMFLEGTYNTARQTSIGGTFADYLGTSSMLWDPSAPLVTPGTGTTSVPTTYIVGPNGDPVTGQYQRTTTTLVNAGLFATQILGNNVKVTVENNHRFGNDPYTGKPWVGSNAYGAEIDYSSKNNFRLGPLFPGTGRQNANVVALGFESAGFNSLGPAAGYSGTTPYQSFYINTLNGYYYYYATAQHWFNPNFRAGLVFEHFGLQPGTTLPAGSATCPGCYIASDNRNALFLDTYFVF